MLKKKIFLRLTARIVMFCVIVGSSSKKNPYRSDDQYEIIVSKHNDAMTAIFACQEYFLLIMLFFLVLDKMPFLALLYL